MYQLKSADLSPAAYQMSSTSWLTWRMALGRLPGEVWIASAWGQLSAQNDPHQPNEKLVEALGRLLGPVWDAGTKGHLSAQNDPVQPDDQLP